MREGPRKGNKQIFSTPGNGALGFSDDGHFKRRTNSQQRQVFACLPRASIHIFIFLRRASPLHVLLFFRGFSLKAKTLCVRHAPRSRPRCRCTYSTLRGTTPFPLQLAPGRAGLPTLPTLRTEPCSRRDTNRRGHKTAFERHREL